jgi:hypothetical protein
MGAAVQDGVITGFNDKAPSNSENPFVCKSLIMHDTHDIW